MQTFLLEQFGLWVKSIGCATTLWRTQLLKMIFLNVGYLKIFWANMVR